MVLVASSAFGQSTELIDAANDGDAERVRELIDAGAAVDGRNARGSTALIEAALRPEVVAALLHAGADVNAVNDDGRTALHLAAGSDRPDIVRVLLRAGADPNRGGSPSALIMAAGRGPLESVRLLVDAGADVHSRADFSIAGVGSGTTDAIGAAANGFHPEIVRLLADRGALTAVSNNVNVRVRDRPSTEGSSAIGSLQKGAAVTVLGRTESEVKVGDLYDYWLRIRLKDGTVGYGYGAFFDVASVPKYQIPEFFGLKGSRWGPPSPSFGFVLDLSSDGTYLLVFAGEGGGQQSRGTWETAGADVVLRHGSAVGKEYLPEWTRSTSSRWPVQEDPANLFYQYRLTNTAGDSFWSLTFSVQPGARRQFQGRAVVAEGDRESMTLENAKVREGPGVASPARTLRFWTPEAGFTTQDFVPKRYPVQLLARTQTAERVQGSSDYWYYVRILVDDDAYGQEYLGWVHGAQLRK